MAEPSDGDFALVGLSKERPILDHHPKAQSEMRRFSYEMRRFSYEKHCAFHEKWRFS